MWHSISIEEIMNKLKTNLHTGLTNEEAEQRASEYGKNELKEVKKETIFIKFIKQLKDFMIIILIIAAVMSIIGAIIEGTNNFVEPFIIIGIVVFNSIMGVLQESKAEKSIEALKSMSAPVSKVKREGIIKIISSSEVVAGDIIIIETGDFVPADARIIRSFNLKVEESSLTGENEPVSKDETVILKTDIPMGDTINMVFSGSVVVNGHAEAIVTDIGMSTKVGKIASMIMQKTSNRTPLQEKLEAAGKRLGVLSLVICMLVFIIGILKNIPLYEMFILSIGLAVAVIPESLPLLVTVILSIGVVDMSKKNAIIRKLPAVETLGSSNIICTDKTGTLTQNKMEVVATAVGGQISALGCWNSKEQENNEKFLLKLGSMCNNAEVRYRKSEVKN